MLRVTASRAFAPNETRAIIDSDPAGSEGRVQAVNRLFSSLYEAIGEAVHRIEQSNDGAAVDGAAPWQRPAGGATLSRERALLEGIEFVLETPRFTYRFLNDLGGLVNVAEMLGERLEPREILGAQRTGDGYRLIRKVLESKRSGFEFTSTRALAELYLRLGGAADPVE